jgi:TPP-dependent pyruvate/acetoin dehydrogenase alpha subunit
VLVTDNDVVAVYEAAGEAVSRARRGGGPTLIEVETDRLFGHFEGDPQVYRTAEELETLRKRDAIHRFEEHLEGEGVMTAAEVAAAWDAARVEVDEAIEFARRSPYPEPASALDHVFAQGGASA